MPNRQNPTAYSLSVTTPPALYPVTLDEVKAHLRFTESEDDALILEAIKEATEKLEDDTRRQFINATIAESYDVWPFGGSAVGEFHSLSSQYFLSQANSMILHRAPVVSVSSISYVDLDGNSQTLGAGNYNLDIVSEPARIEVSYAGSIPAARYQQNAITVTYVAGYGATRDNVPRRAKRAIIMYAGAVYDGRCMAPEEQFAWNSIVGNLQWSL